jgi:glycosyltransferase involved in cell wall biosynthesis
VLRDAWDALCAADLAPLRDLATRGRALEGGPDQSLALLASFLDDLPGAYADAARDAAGSVAFAGRLTHDEVAALVPCCDALVFPSTFPEAFGMVAAEAAAAGVLPVSAAHSGAAEVSRALAEALPEEVSRLLSFELGPDAVAAIADRVNGWLALGDEQQARAGRALRSRVEALWSWEHVAEGVLDAAG